MKKHLARTTERPCLALCRSSSLTAWRLAVVLLLCAIVGQGKASASEGTITATVTVSPLRMIVAAPSSVPTGRTFHIRVTIENGGVVKIQEAAASIVLAKGLELVTHSEEQTLGIIPPQKQKTATWPVRAKEKGEYIISVSASGQFEGISLSEEGTATVAVTEEAPPWWRRFFRWVTERFA